MRTTTFAFVLVFFLLIVAWNVHAADPLQANQAHVYLMWASYLVWVDDHVLPVPRTVCNPIYRSKDVCIVDFEPGQHKFKLRSNPGWGVQVSREFSAVLQEKQTYLLLGAGWANKSYNLYHVVERGPELPSPENADSNDVPYISPSYLGQASWAY